MQIKRLFSYRNMQSWPPFIKANPAWESAYADQLPNGNFLPTAEEAVVWANALIEKIDCAMTATEKAP